MTYLARCVVAFGVVSGAWPGQAQQQQFPWEQGPAFAAPAAAVAEAARRIELPSAGSAADIHILLDDSRYEIDAQGRVTLTWRRVFRLETEESLEAWAAVSHDYEPWYEARPEIRARVITAKGEQHDLDPKTITEGGSAEESPTTFDDRRVVRAPLPGIARGAVVEQEIVVRGHKALFDAGISRRIFLSLTQPVLRARASIEAPAGTPLRAKLYGLPGHVLHREEATTAGGTVRVSFDGGPLTAVEADPLLWPEDESPFGILGFSTGASWQAIASRYAQLVDAQVGQRPALPSALLAEAPATLPREQRIAALVRALHKEVRYTGVQFGEAAYVPRAPAETLKRKFGDCKDKSALLVAMLRASGIEAHLALLLTNSRPDSDTDLPGLGYFDHAIVYVPGTPEPYWIDATDEYARLGEVPQSILSRRALVISPRTTALIMTPELTPASNRSTEAREIRLAAAGPARVVETTTVEGAGASGYRAEYASEDRKAIEKRLAGYVRNNYAAERLAGFTHSDPGDFSKPFELRIEAEKARRGFTNSRIAEAAIPLDGLVNGLPSYFRSSEEDEEGEGEKQQRKAPVRTVDFAMPTPYQLEWRYRVVPPAGYRLRQLPAGGVEKLATASLSKEFTADADGSVSARLRFDSGKRRLTVAEAGELRAAVLGFLKKTEPVLVQFDQAGEMLLEKGDIRGALAEFRALAAAEPRDPIHQTRVARALLAAGAGEAAREAARRATELDPKSAAAWQMLGFALQHDLIGRLRMRGFDHDGAVAAYRKAVELDPANLEARADLAILLEHDASGRRYSPTAKLGEALAEYRKIGDKAEGTALADNLFFALLWNGQFAELKELATKGKQTASRRALRLTAIAAMADGGGAAMALEEARRINASEEERRQAVLASAAQLMNIRRYPEAAALFVAGAKGAPNATQVIHLANLLAKTQRIEDMRFPAGEPASLAKRFLAMMFRQPAPPHREFAALMSRVVPALSESGGRQFAATIRQLHASVKGNLPVPVVADLAISGLQIATEGSEETGLYRLRVQGTGFGGEQTQTMIVVKEEGEYRLLGLGTAAASASSSSDGLEDVARAAFLAARQDKLDYARRLLDWRRELDGRAGGDDALAGSPFARLWEKGAAAPAGKQEILVAAAASFADEEADTDAAMAVLKAARSTLTGERLDAVEVALARGLAKKHHWAELAAVAGALARRHPKSGVAFGLQAGAAEQLRRGAELRALAEARLAAMPGDPDAMRALAIVAAADHDLEALKGWTLKLADAGKAAVGDWNRLAWAHLVAGSKSAGAPPTEALGFLERGLQQQQQHQFPMLHTAAALYAEAGKTTEAREYILQAMSAAGMEEPEDNCWLVFGRIAEQFGLNDVARGMYGRIKPVSEQDDPGKSSSYFVGQRRLVALR